MKALIVDGEELFRLSLKEVVNVAGSFREIVEASSEHEFLAKTANHDDLALVVVHPASLGSEGSDCLKLVRRLYPDAAVVTVLSHEGERTFDNGNSMTVQRSATVVEMVTVLRRALKLPLEGFGSVSNRPASPDVRGAMDSEFGRYQAQAAPARGAETVDLGRLSYRQKQILAMAADGLPNKEIAARLSIAEGTVKAHMHAIFKVLGVSNRTQAVIRYGAAGRAAQAGPTSDDTNGPAGWSFAAAS